MCQLLIWLRDICTRTIKSTLYNKHCTVCAFALWRKRGRWLPACHVHTAPECSYKYEKIYTFHIYHVYGACTVCTCELALRHFFSQGRPKEKWRPQKRTSVFVRLMWGVASLWRLTQIIVSEKLLYPRTYIVALPPKNFHTLHLTHRAKCWYFLGIF